MIEYCEMGGALVVRNTATGATRRTMAVGRQAAPGHYARRWAQAEQLAAELAAGAAGGQADRYMALARADGDPGDDWAPFPS
jgi:hypothetical protein